MTAVYGGDIMTRKCAWAGISFWAALMLSAAFRSELNSVLLAAAFGLAVIAFSAFKKFRVHTAVCLLFFTAGIMHNTLYTHLVYDKLTALDGETVTIEGYISDISIVDDDYDRVTVVGRIGRLPAQISYVIPAEYHTYYDNISITDEISLISDGVKFESGSYNYSHSVFMQGSYGKGSVRLTGGSAHLLLREIRKYRDTMYTVITQVCPDRTGAFLGAMLCGDKSEMSPAMKSELYRSGMGHIFAVSGMHLMYAVIIFSFIIQKLVPSKKAVFALTMAEIWGFALFSGMSVSVVRAAIMLTLTRSGFLFGRKSDGLNSLGISAILLNLDKPYTAISPSFVLSFTAVAVLELVSLRQRDNGDDKAQMSFRLSSAVMFGTAPASAIFFGGVSVMSVVTNILLVPFCALSLQLCFLVLFTGGSYTAAALIVKLAALPVRAVLWASDHISQLSFGYIFTVNNAVRIIVILTSLGMLASCLYIKDVKKLLVSVITAVLCWYSAAGIAYLSDDTLHITVLPNYRGTVYILTKGDSAILIDAGCRGRMNSALQHRLDKLGARELSGAFISENGVGSAASFRYELFLQPQLIFIEDDIHTELTDTLLKKLYTLDEGSSVELDGMVFTLTDKGYELDDGDVTLVLGKKKLAINGETIDISHEKNVLEYNKGELRRL